MNAAEWPAFDDGITEEEAWYQWSVYVENLAIHSVNPARRNYLFQMAEDCRRKAATPTTRGALLVIVGIVYATHNLVERWRAAHADNPMVDWLRRNGL